MLILYFPIADYIFNTTSLIAIEFLHFMNMSHKRWSITWIKFSQIDRNCSLFDNQYLDVEPLAAMMHQSMATMHLLIHLFYWLSYGCSRTTNELVQWIPIVRCTKTSTRCWRHWQEVSENNEGTRGNSQKQFILFEIGLH